MRHDEPDGKLRIVHCFRSPVGGIFRHVRDLVDEQIKNGHEVGIICDSNTGGAFEESLFAQLKGRLALGLHRIPMDRAVGPSDIRATWQLYNKIRSLKIDVLHSHGAKGGAYARLIGTAMGWLGKRPARLYCPHGGSIHYDQTRLSGRIYFRLERFLERLTDRLIFVSRYEREGYFAKVGKTKCPHSLIYNGLREEEFVPVTTSPDAADFVYVGMMRDLKGVDLFLEALPLVARQSGRPVSAVLIGDGPDLDRYRRLADGLGNNATTTFMSPMPVREALALGKCLVVPSRAESFPYIVLETLAAQHPLIATRVGGIPEIYQDHSDSLVEPGSLAALSQAMEMSLQQPADPVFVLDLAANVARNFSSTAMADKVMQAYRAALNDA